MFNGIKRKIAFFNSLTLVAFLCIFFLTIGLFVGWMLGYSGELYLKETADAIITRVISAEYFPEISRPEGKIGGDRSSVRDDVGFDYIIWDANHNATTMQIVNADLLVIGHEMELNPVNLNRFQVFQCDHLYYRGYSCTFNHRNNTCTLQVFQIINSERQIIRYLILFLAGVGFLGILILIPISYFLSGLSLKPIKETFEQQKKFIADASHELRTPLTVIQTNVEVLRMKEDEVLADNIHWLNNIQSESETMARLIKELLMIAQVDNKKIVLEKEVFDISALCAEVVDLMYDVAKDHQILLKGVIPKGIEFNGDAEKLKQAIRILVDNAIKYTPGEGTVTLTLLDTGRNIIIAVQDTGIGLSEEDQKKIFSRFYRVDDARNRESGGVGLGLNIADMVVKQHGGRIEIESKPDEGSTFSIVLPKTVHGV